MDHLWTPWRYHYIRTQVGAADDTCIFCSLLATADEQSYILTRRQLCYAVLNIYPYTTGHLLLVSNRHFASLDEASDAERDELFALAQFCQRALRKAYNPPGFNLGINMGQCAGAGVAGHLHIHLLPRWPGDANFMTTVGETRIVPEAMDQTYLRLKELILQD